MSISAVWVAAATGGGDANPELTNHVKNPKPSHAAASLPSYWGTVNATNSTYAYADGGVHDGITSKKITITGNASCNSQAGISIKNERVNGEVAEGDIVTMAAVMGECTLTGCTLKMRIYWYDSSGAGVSQSDSAGFTPGSPFAQVVHSGTAPATATSFKCQILANGNFSVGDSQVYSICEALAFVTSSAAPVWFDGDSIGAHWTGTRDASTSHRYLCRPESGAWVLEDTSDAYETSLRSPAITAVPGRHYGVMARVTVDSCTGGTFSVDILFYDSTDTYISGYSATGYLTSAAGETLYGYDVRAPITATQACVRIGWIDDTVPTGDCKATVSDVMFGDGVGRAPFVLPAYDQHGEFAAPWNLDIDASTGELAALYAGRYPDAAADIGTFAFEAVDLTWSTVSATTDAAGWPDGAGNTVERRQSATEIYADIDVSDLEPGEYLLVAKCKATTANTGTIRHEYSNPIDIPTTSLGLLNLGTVRLPTNAVRGASTDVLRVYLAGDGTNYGYVNAFFFVPVSFGGFVGWQASSGHAHTLTWEDGVLYVDDAGNMADSLKIAPIVGLGGTLVVIAEQVTPEPTTALSNTLTVVPRYEHFLHA